MPVSSPDINITVPKTEQSVPKNKVEHPPKPVGSEEKTVIAIIEQNKDSANIIKDPDKAIRDIVRSATDASDANEVNPQVEINSQLQELQKTVEILGETSMDSADYDSLFRQIQNSAPLLNKAFNGNDKNFILGLDILTSINLITFSNPDVKEFIESTLKDNYSQIDKHISPDKLKLSLECLNLFSFMSSKDGQETYSGLLEGHIDVIKAAFDAKEDGISSYISEIIDSGSPKASSEMIDYLDQKISTDNEAERALEAISYAKLERSGKLTAQVLDKHFKKVCDGFDETFTKTSEDWPFAFNCYAVCLGKLAAYGTPEVRAKTKDFLKPYFNTADIKGKIDLLGLYCQNLDNLTDALAKNEIFESIQSEVDVLLLGMEDGNEDITVRSAKSVLEQVVRCGEPSQSAFVTDLIYDKYKSIATPEQYGLDRSQLADTWKRSGSDYFDIFEQNLTIIKNLEQKRPGAAATLQREFGISDFARYPTEVLVGQIDHISETDKPYGIMITPQEDISGAFYTEEIKSAIDNMHKEMGTKCYLRIVEVGGKFDLARTLIALDRKYGKERKITFAIFGGHGEPNTIYLGKDEKRGIFETQDFLDLVSKTTTRAKVKSFFTPNPTIIMQSCSTGREQGLAQGISLALNADVIGPDNPTRIENYRITFSKDGQPHPGVSYAEAKPKRYFNGNQIAENLPLAA